MVSEMSLSPSQLTIFFEKISSFFQVSKSTILPGLFGLKAEGVSKLLLMIAQMVEEKLTKILVMKMLDLSGNC